MKSFLRYFSSFLIVLAISTASFGQKKMDFNYKLYHLDSVNTKFHVKIDLNTYLAKIANNAKYVKIGVTVVLTNVDNQKSYRVTREFNLEQEAYEKGIYSSSFDISMQDAAYEMELTIEDRNLNQSREEFREFSKNKKCIPENFMFLNSDSTLVYYKENPIGNKLRFVSKYMQCDSLEVRVFNEIQTIALPPFANKRIYPDFGKYISKLELTCDTIDCDLTNLKNKTLYVSSSKSKGEEGFLISRYTNHYPEIKTVDLLVEPLRYISSRDEYSALTDSTKHRRREFEKFWLDKSDQDRESARHLIKEYYSRVEHANRNYSTYKEGWKTDRGMIYIIFGEPESIDNEGGKEERWIYSSRSGTSSISFSFYREDGNFQENDYALIRNPMFKSMWYDAVDSWRNGMVYRR